MKDDLQASDLVFNEIAREAMLTTPVEIYLVKGKIIKTATVKAGGMWIGRVSAFRKKTLFDKVNQMVDVYYNTLNGL